jgi:hypothetical protein
MRRSAIVMLLLATACGPGEQGEPGVPGPQGERGPVGPAGEPGSAGLSIYEAVGTGQLVVTAATNFSLIPGLTFTVSLPANAKVHVQTNGGLQCTAAGAAYSAVDIAVFVDGSITNAQRRVVAANTDTVGQIIASWSFGRTIPIPAGTHTIEVRAAGADPAMATANVSSASSPQLQGVLTVTTVLE